MKTLTGNTRTRAGWFGKLILQVEESYVYMDTSDPSYGLSPSHGKEQLRWRDARVEDLTTDPQWAQTSKQPEQMVASPPRKPSNDPYKDRLHAALQAERAESEQLRQDTATISRQHADLLQSSAPDAAKAKQLDKLMRYMGSGVSEGWCKVCEIGAVAAWMGIDSALAHLDSLPECNVGLCERSFTIHTASKQ